MPKHFFGNASRPKKNIWISAEASEAMLSVANLWVFMDVYCFLDLTKVHQKVDPQLNAPFLIAGSRGLSSKLQKENWVKGSDNGCCAWQNNRISISSALSGRNKMSGAEDTALKRLKEYLYSQINCFMLFLCNPYFEHISSNMCVFLTWNMYTYIHLYDRIISHIQFFTKKNWSKTTCWKIPPNLRCSPWSRFLRDAGAELSEHSGAAGTAALLTGVVARIGGTSAFNNYGALTW